MRARGPYEVRPRHLRALVFLLALVPLIPTAFVVRFVIVDITNERLDARERARPIYQRFLEGTTTALGTATARQLQVPAGVAGDPWRIMEVPPASGSPADSPVADSLLLADADGHLFLPRAPESARLAPAARLASAVWESGLRVAVLPRSGTPRWRYFSEVPEPLFAVCLAVGERTATGQGGILLLRTREHLRDRIEGFYQHVLDPQTALRLIDENGEGTFVTGVPPAPGQASASGPPAGPPVPEGEPLAEVSLPPPLPAWRAQLYTVDPSLVDGIAREQIALYWWSVAGMIAVTAAIAGAAGWVLTRRIALHELSNDALAVVSHEMKTPLASTRLFIETLLERRYRGGPDQADDYLRLIAEENVRLERLVDGFQTLSRLEYRRGRPQLSREPIPAGEPARVAAQRLRSRLEATGCTFTLIGADEQAPVLADREALITVLVNLLDNALKYTGDDKRIALRCEARAGAVTYEVSDNGQGIEPVDERRIFERFYQGDRRLSRSHEGCGLGLSIVRSLVRAHRGTVSVQSTPGQGSKFTVKLPGGQKHKLAGTRPPSDPR